MSDKPKIVVNGREVEPAKKARLDKRLDPNEVVRLAREKLEADEAAKEQS
jgi:hypothetical protein